VVSGSFNPVSECELKSSGGNCGNAEPILTETVILEARENLLKQVRFVP